MIMKKHFLTVLLCWVAWCTQAQIKADTKEWKQLFNGKNLDGWDIKIRNYDLNDNFANTFRVKDGKLVVAYDGYDKFNERFGHIFYKEKFSNYIIATEYRFVGEQAPEGPGWAFRNSGIMLHCQPAASMGKDQDFPISIEVQLLGGTGKGERTTCNLCTPGTNVEINGKLFTPHCLNSKSKTYNGDQWVRAEVMVLGDSLIRHYVNGEMVMEYQKPQIGGGNVDGYNPFYKEDGKMLTQGYISLQSESHPVEFRKVEVLSLIGCTDPKALNFKSYYIKSAPSECIYTKKRKRSKA